MDDGTSGASAAGDGGEAPDEAATKDASGTSAKKPKFKKRSEMNDEEKKVQTCKTPLSKC